MIMTVWENNQVHQGMSLYWNLSDVYPGLDYSFVFCLHFWKIVLLDIGIFSSPSPTPPFRSLNVIQLPCGPCGFWGEVSCESYWDFFDVLKSSFLTAFMVFSLSFNIYTMIGPGVDSIVANLLVIPVASFMHRLMCFFIQFGRLSYHYFLNILSLSSTISSIHMLIISMEFHISLSSVYSFLLFF